MTGWEPGWVAPPGWNDELRLVHMPGLQARRGGIAYPDPSSARGRFRDIFTNSSSTAGTTWGWNHDDGTEDIDMSTQQDARIMHHPDCDGISCTGTCNTAVQRAPGGPINRGSVTVVGENIGLQPIANANITAGPGINVTTVGTRTSVDAAQLQLRVHLLETDMSVLSDRLERIVERAGEAGLEVGDLR